MRLEKNKRIFMYIFVCLIIRLSIPLGMIYVHKSKLQYVSIPLFILSIGFFNAFMTLPKTDIGFFGGRKWWVKNHIVHSIMYLTAAVMAFKKNKHSYIPLIVDVVYSFFVYIHHYLTV